MKKGRVIPVVVHDGVWSMFHREQHPVWGEVFAGKVRPQEAQAFMVHIKDNPKDFGIAEVGGDCFRSVLC